MYYFIKLVLIIVQQVFGNMTFREYLKQAKEFAKEHPTLLDKDVVYSKDDEGNGFDKVIYTMTYGHNNDTEFTPYEDNKNLPVNSICIN